MNNIDICLSEPLIISIAEFHLKSKKFGLAMATIRLLSDESEKKLRIDQIYMDYYKYNMITELRLDSIHKKIEMHLSKGEYAQAIDDALLLPEEEEEYRILRKIYTNSICDGNLVCAESVANLLPNKERLIRLKDIFLVYMEHKEFANARNILDQLSENEEVKYLLQMNPYFY